MTLRPAFRGTRPTRPQPDQVAGQRLEPEPASERRGQHHAGVRNRPFVIELDVQPVQSDRRLIVHHEHGGAHDAEG